MPGDLSDKPYAFVPLCSNPPQRQPKTELQSQGSFATELLTGKLYLQLTVKTITFVSSGITARDSDLALNQNQAQRPDPFARASKAQKTPVKLVKTAILEENNYIIPGSSLKGVIRSAYEAITRSCLCVLESKRQEIMETDRTCVNIPAEYKQCVGSGDQDQTEAALCPACRVFGAMGWKGLVHFRDAHITGSHPLSTLSPLFAPDKDYEGNKKISKFYVDENGQICGRKFYRQAQKAVGGKLPIQSIGVGTTFTTEILIKNLKREELGALLILLGQDPKSPLALKLGAGKPRGLGTLRVEVTAFEQINHWQDRYSDYDQSGIVTLEGDRLKVMMQAAIEDAKHRSGLVQQAQLKALTHILKWPTNYQAPEGNY